MSQYRDCIFRTGEKYSHLSIHEKKIYGRAGELMVSLLPEKFVKEIFQEGYGTVCSPKTGRTIKIFYTGGINYLLDEGWWHQGLTLPYHLPFGDRIIAAYLAFTTNEEAFVRTHCGIVGRPYSRSMWFEPEHTRYFQPLY